MEPPVQSQKDQVRQLLFEARRKLTDRALDEAESLYEQVLGLDPTEEAAYDGLEQIELQRVVSQDGVASADWQQQYAAGADESVDLPPALAHDIFDTLPPSPTGPPTEVEAASDTAPPSPIGLTEPTNLGEHDVHLNSSGGTAVVGTQSANPSRDPFTWGQREMSAPLVDADAGPGSSGHQRSPRQPRGGEVAPTPASDEHVRTPMHVSTASMRQRDAASHRASEIGLERPSPSTSVREERARAGERVLGEQIPSVSSKPVAPNQPIYAFNQQRTLDLTLETLDEDVDDDDTVNALLHMAHRRHDAGDFSGSMEFVEKVLVFQHDHPVATALAELNQARLLEMYRARLGDVTRPPKLRLRQQEYVWQSLTHQEGFVLSLVDGQTRYSDIIEIAAMPEFDATRILSKLVELQIIG